MKYIYSLIAIAFICNSCGEEAQNTPNQKIIEHVKEDTTISNNKFEMDGCYRLIIENDTATMDVTQQQNYITGSLVYKRDGKDNNIGTVNLVKTTDRVEGWYKYQSEGITSVRQVVFKPTNNSFAEGYGDIKMNGDTAMFKYPHALHFEEKHTFNKINCP